MMSINKDLEWLSRQIAEYRSYMDDAMGVVEDLDELGKLGRGFSSMDDLEEVEIADGVISRPTYVSARLSTSQKNGINWIVEVIHVLFCLGLHRDAQVKQGALRTSATD
jgi:hypothetical protein